MQIGSGEDMDMDISVEVNTPAPPPVTITVCSSPASPAPSSAARRDILHESRTSAMMNDVDDQATGLQTVNEE